MSEKNSITELEETEEGTDGLHMLMRPIRELREQGLEFMGGMLAVVTSDGRMRTSIAMNKQVNVSEFFRALSDTIEETKERHKKDHGEPFH